MKKIYFTIPAFLLFASVNLAAQCTLTIGNSGNDTVCSGEPVTLTANPLGPSTALNTTMAAGNNHRGNMFDITAINTVTILSFDASPMAATTIAIYFKTGTWVGFDQNPAAWTLIGSAAVPGATLPNPVPVPVAVNLSIPAGQTGAFYITSTNTAVSLNYTDGTSVGNVFASDANIQFKEGCGHEYPFSSTPFTPRVWNGVIHYSTSAGSPTYLWSTSAVSPSTIVNPLVSTVYTVQVNMPGCPSLMNDTLAITVSTPTANAGNNFAVCAGSSATLTGAGTGNGFLQYFWDQAVINNVPFQPSSTLNYVLTLMDGYGCTATDTTTITLNPLPAVTARPDTTICGGTSITLSGSGATSYVWDHSVTDGAGFIPAGTLLYHVTGTDVNGCSAMDSVTISVNPAPTTIAPADTIVCEFSSLALSGSGTAVSFAWSGGIFNANAFVVTAPASYVVTGMDVFGCTSMDTVNVMIHAVDVSTTTVNETITANDTNATYQWIDCNTMQPLAGETNQSFTATVNGSYAVIVNDGVCSDTSACEIILSTGMDAITVSSVSAYPNPTGGVFVLNTNTLAKTIAVKNVAGQVVVSFTPQQENETISLENEPAGVYFIQVTSQDDEVTTLKIVKH